MKKIIRVPAIMFLAVSLASAASVPDTGQKVRVRLAVRSVENTARRTATLDEFGRNTLVPSKEILDIGPGAVYELSRCLVNTDWKVRYWIVDMLGYLDNPEAVRPLMRVIADPGEKAAVKERARKTLAMIRGRRGK